MGEFDDILGPDKPKSKPSSGAKITDFIEAYEKAQRRWQEENAKVIEQNREIELEEIKKRLGFRGY